MSSHSAWPVWKATVLASGTGALFGGVELLLILTLRVCSHVYPASETHIDQGPFDRGVEWPMIIIGVIAAILLAAGLLPPYPELWKRKGRVVGIST